jgi:hypothetical protein
MATKKKAEFKSTKDLHNVEWPRVTVGSHSTRYEYEDGRVELITDWEALRRDVREAIANYEAENGKAKINPPPVKAKSTGEEKPKRSPAKITAKKKVKK